MRNLALLYECGLGVGRDYQKAFDLYWRAAELGDAAAHMGVAGYRFTRREKIMPQDTGEAEDKASSAGPEYFRQ